MDKLADPIRPQQYVLVRRTGGAFFNRVVDGATLTISCYAPDSAEELAYRAEDLLYTASLGSWSDFVDDQGNTDRAWFTGYESLGGCANYLDPDVRELDRWVFTVRLGVATHVC